MKRSKRLYVLLGILAVVCVVTFGVCKYEETKENIKNSDKIILELQSDDVTALSWECSSQTLAFHKDDVWIYDEDEAFPVSEEKVNDLLEMFQEFGVSFIIEEVEDYGQYGLDDSVCTINIETENETYEIKLGDYSTMDSQRYVSIGDGNVYLVNEDPLEAFDIVLSDMIENDDIPDFDDAKVSEIEFTGSEDYEIFYEEDSKNTYCEDDVYFTKQDENTRPLDTSRVDSYLDTISNLGQSEYVTYNASGEDLETYGLDKPELAITVQYTIEDEENEEATEGTFVLNVARDPKEAEEAEKSDDEDEEEEITAYVRIGESKIIYKLTTDEYKNLMKASYNDLRHQEVLSADFDDIEKIDLSLEGEDYTITSREKNDEKIYYYGEEELEIDDFKSALQSLTADSFTEVEPDGKEEISLTVYLDNENYPEVRIELYRYDGSFCLAVVDGETVSLVERNKVVDLVETVNAIVLN